MSIIPTKNIWHIGRLMIYFFALILIYSLQGSFLASESICYWYTNFDFICPMCGGTRSFLHFMYLDFSTAFSYNQALTLGLYPIGAFLVVQDSYAIVTNSFFQKKNTSMLLYFLQLFNRRT